MSTEQKYVDLHTHSYKSDGSLSPAEVVKAAKEAGLSAIALTDHDTMEGVEEAMEEGRKSGIEVVPAIEFSVKSKTQNHILAFYPDINNRELRALLAELKMSRHIRNLKTVELLEKLGMKVSLDDVKNIAGSEIIGRAHFAKILVEKGHVQSVKEAFDRFLGTGRPAFTSFGHPEAEKVIRLIHGAGGVSVMAHLHQTKLPDDELQQLLTRLKGYGLDGIEGYYTEYTPEMQAKFQGWAKERGLLLSGGSDFHGSMKPAISIGTGYGSLRVPYTTLESIKTAKENIQL